MAGFFIIGKGTDGKRKLFTLTQVFTCSFLFYAVDKYEGHYYQYYSQSDERNYHNKSFNQVKKANIIIVVY